MSGETPAWEEIVEALQKGERNIVNEAADIYETNHNNIEVRHDAANGEVVVQLSAEFAWGLGDHEEEMLPDEEAERI